MIIALLIGAAASAWAARTLWRRAWDQWDRQTNPHCQCTHPLARHVRSVLDPDTVGGRCLADGCICGMYRRSPS